MSKSLTRRELLIDGLKYGTFAVVSADFLAACLGAQPSGSSGGSGLTGTAEPFEDQIPSLENAYWQQWAAGAKLASQKLNLNYSEDSSEASVAKHITIMENTAARGIHMAIMTANDAASIVQISKLAADSSIWFGNSHSHQAWTMVETLGQHYAMYSTPDNVNITYLLGKSVFKAIGGQGKVIEIKGIPGHTAAILRSAGYAKAAQEFPGIEVVASDYGYFDRVHTQPVFERLLTAHPDIKAVLCASDDSGMGVIPVLKERNLKKVLVTGVDAIAEFVDAISAGQNAHATCDIHGSWNGCWLAVTVFDARHGFKPDPLERMLVTDGLILNTPDAAKAFSEQFQKSTTLPFDPVKMSRLLTPKDWAPQNGLRVFDPDRDWTPVAPKPGGWTPPTDWTASKNAGKIDTLNSDYQTRYAALDPFKQIKSLTNPV